MFSSRLSQAVAKRVKEHAAPGGLCKTFHDHINYLYTLSLLLTADHDKAEQCFVAGLEDCLEGRPALREWAHSWARRAIIRNAIRVVSPTRNEIQPAAQPTEGELPETEAGTPAAAITRLQPFERFVYVMSLLEGYSDRECSVLLGCTISKIARARSRALQQVAGVLLHSESAT